MLIAVSAQARAELEKRRKRALEAARRGEPPTDAHAMADGHMDAVEADEAAQKAYQDRGASEGPGRPMTPGTLAPGDLQRPYISAGHASPSPENSPSSDGAPAPGLAHVDLRAARGRIVKIDPMTPGGQS